jgi:hypothetical protein
MVVAAQMLGDAQTLAALTREVHAIPFDRLLSPEGFVLHGFRDDGCTRLPCDWRDWGGETALVLLLEQMATGRPRTAPLSHPGEVYRGVGFIAEIQSLFYPQFAGPQPDALTGVNWLQARQRLLDEQRHYFPTACPASAAALLGLYGLSAGRGCPGHGYAVDGTRQPGLTLIHPHYILMSGLLWPRVTDVYQVLQALEAHELFPPWGLVENVTADLRQHLPGTLSLNASFESLSAYHLWAQQAGFADRIYAAATQCPLLRDAVQAFYPPAGTSGGASVLAAQPKTSSPGRPATVSLARPGTLPAAVTPPRTVRVAPLQH